ncbi:MAG: cytochrome-c oxidase, cbb3-type subunit III [Aquabacterium sp.]
MSDFVSSGWAWYVAAIVVFGLVYCVVVLVGAARHKVVYDAQGNVDKTTGHVWDGDLQELNNPLPRWWLMLFIITLVFAVAYLLLYPGLGVYQGKLGWTSVGQLENETRKAHEAQSVVYAKFEGKSVEDLSRDPAAQAIGERLFLNNCAACHGSDAKGSKSFPNLTDSDWLYGGSPDKIIETIHGGRRGMMPPMAAAVGGPDEVRQVAHYVLSLSGSAHNAVLAAQGRAKFNAACAACHGAEGKGNQALGSANLSDKIWLHGWGEEAIVRAINNGITNKMPAQSPRLSDEQIRVVASYVWGLSNNKTRVADAK